MATPGVATVVRQPGCLVCFGLKHPSLEKIILVPGCSKSGFSNPDFSKIWFFQNPGFFQKSSSEKIRFSIFLTSKKYGVNDPSGISHFCLSSKLHFFVFLSVFAKKLFLGVILRPFGVINVPFSCGLAQGSPRRQG